MDRRIREWTGMLVAAAILTVGGLWMSRPALALMPYDAPLLVTDPNPDPVTGPDTNYVGKDRSTVQHVKSESELYNAVAALTDGADKTIILDDRSGNLWHLQDTADSVDHNGTLEIGSASKPVSRVTIRGYSNNPANTEIFALHLPDSGGSGATGYAIEIRNSSNITLAYMTISCSPQWLVRIYGESGTNITSLRLYRLFLLDGATGCVKITGSETSVARNGKIEYCLFNYTGATVDDGSGPNSAGTGGYYPTKGYPKDGKAHGLHAQSINNWKIQHCQFESIMSRQKQNITGSSFVDDYPRNFGILIGKNMKNNVGTLVQGTTATGTLIDGNRFLNCEVALAIGQNTGTHDVLGSALEAGKWQHTGGVISNNMFFRNPRREIYTPPSSTWPGWIGSHTQCQFVDAKELHFDQNTTLFVNGGNWAVNNDVIFRGKSDAVTATHNLSQGIVLNEDADGKVVENLSYDPLRILNTGTYPLYLAYVYFNWPAIPINRTSGYISEGSYLTFTWEPSDHPVPGAMPPQTGWCAAWNFANPFNLPRSLDLHLRQIACRPYYDAVDYPTGINWANNNAGAVINGYNWAFTTNEPNSTGFKPANPNAYTVTESTDEDQLGETYMLGLPRYTDNTYVNFNEVPNVYLRGSDKLKLGNTTNPEPGVVDKVPFSKTPTSTTMDWDTGARSGPKELVHFLYEGGRLYTRADSPDTLRVTFNDVTDYERVLGVLTKMNPLTASNPAMDYGADEWGILKPRSGGGVGGNGNNNKKPHIKVSVSLPNGKSTLMSQEEYTALLNAIKAAYNAQTAGLNALQNSSGTDIFALLRSYIGLSTDNGLDNSSSIAGTGTLTPGFRKCDGGAIGYTGF